MKTEKLILIREIENHYELEAAFFRNVELYDLLEIYTVSQQKYLHRKQLGRFEKILRLHQDLDINFEGIDVIFNLMKRISRLEKELNRSQSQLDLLDF